MFGNAMRLVVVLISTSISLAQTISLINNKSKNHTSAGCRKVALDLTFIVDGSRSVRPRNFLIMKDFIKGLIDAHDISQSATRVAVIQFSTEIREEILLNETHNSSSIRAAIDSIQYMEKGTMLGLALEHFVVHTFPQARLDQHPAVSVKGIVITDGRSQDYVTGKLSTYQRIAKERGVELFAIAVGRSVKTEELNEMVSRPVADHVFHVRDYRSMRELNVRWGNRITCSQLRDVDECLRDDQNNCSQLCINTPGSFRCDCRRGFMLAEDGTSCTDVNECLRDDQHSCWQLCINTPGSFRCDCRRGFMLAEDGTSCIDEDECVSGAHNCSQICINTIGEFRCMCEEGFWTDDEGSTCNRKTVLAPTNLRIDDLSHTSARAKWSVHDVTHRNFEASHYIVKIWHSERNVSTTSRKALSISFYQLKPSTSYVISVTAVCTCYLNSTSEEIVFNFTTLALGRTELNLTQAGVSSLVARWTAAGGDGLTGYKLRYRKLTNSGESGAASTAITKSFHSSMLTVNLTDLQPGLYRVKVTPRYGKLKGGSGVDTRHTAKLVPNPSNLRILQPTRDSVQVCWDMNDIGEKFQTVAGYTLSYQPDGESSTATAVAIGDTCGNLTHIASWTQYNVSVVAQTTTLEVSERITGNFTSLGFNNQPTCSCQSYMERQVEMQSALTQLVRQVEKLTSRLEVAIGRMIPET